jgi:hypothetical protein
MRHIYRARTRKALLSGRPSGRPGFNFLPILRWPVPDPISRQEKQRDFSFADLKGGCFANSLAIHSLFASADGAMIISFPLSNISTRRQEFRPSWSDGQREDQSPQTSETTIFNHRKLKSQHP